MGRTMEFPMKNGGKPMKTLRKLMKTYENLEISSENHDISMEMSMKKNRVWTRFSEKGIFFWRCLMDSIVCLSHTGLFGIARIEFYSAIDGGFVYQQVLLIIWEINDGIS